MANYTYSGYTFMANYTYSGYTFMANYTWGDRGSEGRGVIQQSEGC